MLIRLLCVLLLSVCSIVTFAGVLPGAMPFRLVMPDEALKAVLTSGLKTQREENEEFKRYKEAEKAAQFDRAVLNQLLRAEGYYAASVTTHVQGKEITHTITPGSVYRVESVEYRFPENATPLSKYQLPIQPGMPLQARRVLDAEKVLKDYIVTHYCLYDVVMDYRVKINHKTKRAFITYHLAPSPQVYFDEPQVSGNGTLKAAYLKSFFTFKKGDCFQRKTLELTRIKLLQTNLIAKVDVAIGPPGSGAESNTVAIGFDVLERKHKTIKAGLGYDGDIGPRYLVGWQHRNVQGGGELLDIELRTSAVEEGVFSKLTVPNFFRPQQTLELQVDANSETTDQYDSSYLDFGATLSRPIQKKWRGSVGMRAELSRVEDVNYQLLSFPVTLSYFSAEDRFNPASGYNGQFQVRPFVNVRDNYSTFTQSTLTLSAYYTPHRASKSPIPFWKRPTLAGRVAFGSLNAKSLDAVPENHRFYVGGGGSVRGYAYQSVGDLNAENETEGGLSYSEYSLEMRFRLSESWGLVLFQDAGYAYPGERPRFGTDFIRGAGLGVRYFTSFAPIRFDIATPLDARDNVQSADENDSIDNRFEIYISIGQAF